MLIGLSIRNVVLIDKLDLEFQAGLCALTGETGAGKSILLGALGLATGGRAESRLLRKGSDQASVAAVFQLEAGDPAVQMLAERELAAEDDMVYLRRTLAPDGRSRAFVNDHPVTIGFLRALGDQLIEVQGQFEQRGLLDGATHRRLLDIFGGLGEQRGALAALWQKWQAAEAAHQGAIEDLAMARREEAFLRHAVEELEHFEPRPGEEGELSDLRHRLKNREKLVAAARGAVEHLEGNEHGSGADGAIGHALRLLDQVADQGGALLAAARDSLLSASSELADASARLNDFAQELDQEEADLAAIEDRYFGLQDLARKHNCTVDALCQVLQDARDQLAAIDDSDAHLAALEAAAAAAKDRYVAAAEALSAARHKAGKGLVRAVNKELTPLKLEKARFCSQITPLAPERWGEKGMDRVQFLVSTNPGAEPGPLGKVASGGELSRLLLALKVVLSQDQPGQTLIFDEVDSGVGGATAQAVGERLARLAHDRQVLVVTHSPQVAAQANSHLKVRKKTAAKKAATEVLPLTEDGRQEEIARMLSGAEVTSEARAAAARLMGVA